jgi:hypothetical protein
LQKTKEKIEKILSEHPPRQFSVTDRKKLKSIDKARSKLDEIVDKKDGMVIHHLVRWRSSQEDECLALLERLLEAGADPDVPDPSDRGRTPMHLCCLAGRVKLAKAILLCRPNMGALDADGSTPLELTLSSTSVQ